MNEYNITFLREFSETENPFVRAVGNYLNPFYVELNERKELYNSVQNVLGIYSSDVKAVLKYVFFQHVIDDCTNAALALDVNFLTRESKPFLTAFRFSVMEIIDHAYIDGQRRFAQLYPDTDPEDFLTQCNCNVALMANKL